MHLRLELIVWDDRFGLVHATEGLDCQVWCLDGQHVDVIHIKYHPTVQNII